MRGLAIVLRYGEAYVANSFFNTMYMLKIDV